MHDVRAGQVAGPEDLIDVARLVTAYYALHPDPAEPGQRVAFGTSGHRGSSLAVAFNEDHIAATSQAICEYRAEQGTDGPLFLGADTHALSGPARATALEVFAANDVTVLIDQADGYTPTPAVSLAILTHNRNRTSGLADGVVVTPSLAKLSPHQITADTLAGDPVTSVLTEAPGNGAALGGIKGATANAWFADRPSGTEDVYKIYGESFLGEDHLRRVQEEARSVVLTALGT